MYKRIIDFLTYQSSLLFGPRGVGEKKILKNKYLLLITVIIILQGLYDCVSLRKDRVLKYSFFVAGHTYGSIGADFEGFYPPFKDKFDFINNYPKMRFGVLTGDVTYKSREKDWQEIDEDLKDLKVPIHIAAGNHDVGKAFTSRYKKTFYDFEYGGDLFIILDSNHSRYNIVGEQLEFLKGVLNNKTKNKKRVFVFVHHFIWKNSSNVFKNLNKQWKHNLSTFGVETLPLFKKIDKPIYFFAGDVGQFANGEEYHFYQQDNCTFVGSGMGGRKRDNIVIIEVSEIDVQLKLIALNGDDVNALGSIYDYKLP